MSLSLVLITFLFNDIHRDFRICSAYMISNRESISVEKVRELLRQRIVQIDFQQA